MIRSFEVLRLIRDGVITNMDDIDLIANSKSYHYYMRPLEGCRSLGLIECSRFDEASDAHSDEITPTPKLAEFLSAFNLSLTQLSPLTSESVICDPAFGSPSEPAVASDIFVLMPFHEDLLPIYEDHIKKVAKKLDRTVARADDFFTAGSIIGDIWNAISAAKTIIADCTGRNPNVFYEIGIAHTLGRPVILIAQTKDDIPFDVQHIRAILYDFTPRGMREFEAKLHSTLEHEVRRRSLEEYLVEYRKDRGRQRKNG